MANLYEVVDIQQMQDQSLMNRYYYFDVNGVYTAQDVAESFVEYIVPEIMQVQSATLEHTAVRVKELTNTYDQYQISLVDALGQRSGDAISVFVNWGFQLFPATKNFKVGRKAIAGVAETDQVAGDPTAGANTLLETLEPWFYTLFSAGGNSIVPVLARFVVAADLWKITQITNALWKRVSTQNTRKRYSGGGDIPLLSSNDTWSYVGGLSAWDKTPTVVLSTSTTSTPVHGDVNVIAITGGTVWN